jgi:hypothetical protein
VTMIGHAGNQITPGAITKSKDQMVVRNGEWSLQTAGVQQPRSEIDRTHPSHHEACTAREFAQWRHDMLRKYRRPNYLGEQWIKGRVTVFADQRDLDVLCACAGKLAHQRGARKAASNNDNSLHGQSRFACDIGIVAS